MDVSIYVANSASDISVGTKVFRGSLVAHSATSILLVSRNFVSTLSWLGHGVEDPLVKKMVCVYLLQKGKRECS